MNHFDTRENIAKDEGVSRATVNRITPETVSPEVLALVPQEQEKLYKKLERLQGKALQRIDEALDRDNSPLTQLATTFGILYDKGRLEQGLATQITEKSVKDKAFEYFSQLSADHGHDIAVEIFLRSDAVRGAIGASVEEWEKIPEESS